MSSSGGISPTNADVVVTDPGATQTIQPTNPAAIPLIAKANATQAADLFQVLNSAGAPGFRCRAGASAEFDLTFTVNDGVNMHLGSTTGMKIGDGATQKLAFWNATPIAQPAAPVQPIATASTNVAPFGYATAAQADALVTAVRLLIALMSAALGGNGLTA